jgi:Flp pilus assembly protein TadD
MDMGRPVVGLIVSMLLIVPLGACELTGDSENEAKPEAGLVTAENAPEQPYLQRAKEHFRQGDYGLAEKFYRQAVEERHQNVEAWLGLAATYDHLKRFDEADRAYKVVTKMAGHTPTVLNNLGYHYMLKGEFARAQQTLEAARAQEPENPNILRNLELLQTWKAAAGKKKRAG